ncbi:MAG: phenylalanine--tRNA ligase beta subunit-related protein [Candidatus Undinarchaeales archaeon]|jgi:lysyl-tRNA synthetase class 2|nr:phenylalanine--tRNA ligase beta subunit-related protein [Candidatus Undinarchaeales archaeon]
MKFEINPEIFEKFPGLNLGVVIAKNVDNAGENVEIIKFLREQEKAVADTLETETLSQNPKIAPWRAAYSSFGAKPKKYKCSVEALMRRAIKGEELPHISKLVDVYNALSLKHILPMGGDDIDNIDGNVMLKIADGTEKFVPLLSKEVENPHAGEVVYEDDKDILCRRWNWRECDKSKMTEETKNVILYVEGLVPVEKAEVESAISELAELVKKYCGTETTEIVTKILSKEDSSVEF